MYDAALTANAAYEEARALVTRLDAAGPTAAAFKTEVEAVAPKPRPAGPGRGFGGGAPTTGPPTLDGVSQSLMSASMSMQEAEVAPTARQIAACDAARGQMQDVMKTWAALRTRAGGYR